jgi:hydroxymethylpyrimidine pyrophosphatase-like HAD family hydrolase
LAGTGRQDQTAPMSDTPSAIVCLDLDGTSLDHDGLHVWFAPAVAQAINEASRRGAVWCPNSGRTAENQMGIVQACRELETMPTAILAGERYVYDVHRTGQILKPRQPGNESARRKAKELAPLTRAALEPSLAELKAQFGPAEWYPREEFVAWLLTDTTDPTAFVEAVQRLLQPLPQAQVLHNGRWVVVTHADFGKGRVLAAVAAGLDVPRERILAIGDQPNDLDMLDGRVAAYVGCPSDAAAAIKATVRNAGGWIADKPGTAGTADLIRRFATGVL